MFTLAWLLLPDQPAFRTVLILTGIARCIAMVLTWIVRFWFGEIARAMLIVLGIPLEAGVLTRLVGVRLRGPRW